MGITITCMPVHRNMSAIVTGKNLKILLCTYVIFCRLPFKKKFSPHHPVHDFAAASKKKRQQDKNTKKGQFLPQG